MQQALEEAKARLLAGHDPDEVLTQFAAKVKGRACPNCGADDLCFRCKATDVLGDKAALALPLLIPKLAAMVKQWHAERLERKAQEQVRGRPWKPPGNENF